MQYVSDGGCQATRCSKTESERLLAAPRQDNSGALKESSLLCLTCFCGCMLLEAEVTVSPPAAQKYDDDDEGDGDELMVMVMMDLVSSVGAHVRDAAAYVCWAVARAYAPQTLAPILTFLAPHLLVVACFDREVRLQSEHSPGRVCELSWHRARTDGLCPSVIVAARQAVVWVGGLQAWQVRLRDPAGWSCVLLCMLWLWWTSRLHGVLCSSECCLSLVRAQTRS